MKYPTQANESRPIAKNNFRRINHFRITNKKCKPVKGSLKKVSTTLETILRPTSSSIFKCESIKRPDELREIELPVNCLKGVRLNRKKRKMLKMMGVEPISSMVEPYIVKMTKPTSLSDTLITMLDDERLPKHDKPDPNILKSLTSGYTEKSSMKNNDSNEVFPKQVQKAKDESIENPPKIEKTSSHTKPLSKEVNSSTRFIQQNSYISSSDYFVIKFSNSCNNEISQVYKINNSKFLISMKPGKRLYFVGMFDLELPVLSGCVEILGYRPSKNKPQEKLLTVYSCQGTSHLFIKATTARSHPSEDLTQNRLEKLLSLGFSIGTAQQILKETGNSAMFVLNRNISDVRSTVWPMFFENHLSFPIFPPVDLLRKDSRQCHIFMERSIGCICQGNLQELGYKEFNEVPEWSPIEQNILSKDVFKMVLCGGKSVGKSTLLRYLVNKCLEKWENVLVIDCDLGQCEFTPPGCISVTLVNQPLLGPNYSHLKEPSRCVYLGEVDVTKCPENYMKGYKWLIDYAKREHGNIPWLINTMGFTKGFGVMVACDIIKIVNPCQVIQIESRDRKLNFPERLEPGYVYSQNTEASSGCRQPLDFNLYVIPSGSESGTVTKSRGLSPAESRNLVILSYLSEMLGSEILHLSQVVPYKIDMDLLELQITNKYSLNKEQIAAAMNGNLVALCSLNERDLFPNCLGFGIVRAVDRKTNTIYLITPMPASSLSSVNCLQKGNISLPESLYFNQGEVEGRVPYLAVTSGNATARFAKRDYRSLPAASSTSATSI